LSKKFIDLDPIIIREIEAILNPTYDLIDELMAKIDGLNFDNLSNQDIALLFIDVMDYPLGEIYRLNVVQIEYSLNYALHTILKEYEPNSVDRNFLLSKLIAPGELTVAQEEEIQFSKIIRRARKLNISSPYDNVKIHELFLAHIKTYGPKHCAYGVLPPTANDYISKFEATYRSGLKLLTNRAALRNLENQVVESNRTLEKIGDQKLSQLCQLMAKIGVFRDKNKAKLGETVVRRLKIMDIIADRAGENRQNIDHYLISEIVSLLDTGQKIAKSTLIARKNNGVCFERSEDVRSGIVQINTQESAATSAGTLMGICASSGYVEGSVKIIYSKDDITKMRSGDIMVSIGTDFDLIEIMNMSSGIITEEGGLLSHASVVSRELKKPCLIGVEDATSTLSDGDIVRLDASNGKLEIIK